MARLRPAPRRFPSRVLALATVAFALAAAPVARAGNYYWQGGAYTKFSQYGWNNGVNADGIGVTTAYWDNLYFGYQGPASTTGNLDDDYVRDLKLGSLNFAGQSWNLSSSKVYGVFTGDAGRLRFSGGGINVASSAPKVQISSDIVMDQPLIGGPTSLTLNVAYGSELWLNSIAGNGKLIKTGDGDTYFQTAHTYTGGTSVVAGTLIDYAPSGNYNVDATLRFNIGSNQTFGGTVSGGGFFYKDGTGILTMTGNTAWTGGTSVKGGTLVMKNPWSSGGYYMDGGNLEFDTNESRTYANYLFGYGTFTKSGTGALTLTNTSNFLGSSGKVVVNGGRLVEKVVYDAPHAVAKNAALEFNVAADRTFDKAISGAGSFTKSGAGTLTLTGLETYTGGTFVNAGRLVDPNPHGDYVTNAALEFRTASDVTYAGVVSGSGSLTKADAGTLTLSGKNTYSGGTTVNAGRLIDKNPHGDYVTNADLEFANATGVVLLSQGPDGFLIPNTISGTGNFTKSGAGDLILLGSSTYAGSTTVNGGLLAVAGNDLLPTATALTVGVYGTFSVQGRQTVGSLAGDGGVNLASGGLTVNGSASTRFWGAVSGSGSLTKAGSGTLTLSGKDTYSGGTVVNGGRLIDFHPHGSYVTNATLELQTDGVIPYFYLNDPISGTGDLVKSGPGMLLFLSPGSYAGSTTINGGALGIDSDEMLPTSTALTVNAGGEFHMYGVKQSVASLSGAGSLVLGQGARFSVVGAASTTFSGVASDAGSLIKSGAGTLTLTGQNTYTAGTTVNGGRLIDANPQGSYVTNAALEFRNANDLAYANAITGTGSFTKSGAGTLTLSGANTYAGGTTVNGGRLIDLNPHGAYVTNAALEFAKDGDYAYGSAVAGTGSFTKSGVGTLTLSGANTYTGGTTVSAGRLVDLNPHGDYTANAELEFRNAGNVNFWNPTTFQPYAIGGTGAFTKSGSGTLVMLAPNSYAGSTTVSAGTLVAVRSDNVLPTATALTVGSGATFVLGADRGQTIGSLSGAGSVALGANASFRVAGAASTTFSGAVSGFGSLIKSGAGTLTLSNAPANTGGVRVSGGTLSVRGAGALGGGLAVDSGATLENASGGALSVGGASLNQGAVRTSGGAATVFTGIVSGAGSFTGTGAVEFDGGYSPGNSPASVRFDGDLKLGSTNALRMELGSAILGTGYDHLTVNGTAFLGGALDVAYLNGFVASAGQSFDLFDFAHSSGTFASLNLPTLSNGLVWNTSSLYTSGTLSVQAVPEPAAFLPLGMGALCLLRRRKR